MKKFLELLASENVVIALSAITFVSLIFMKG